ncbi:hypothetical protein HFP72_01285 [Nocardiopsis sp. ARC36]
MARPSHPAWHEELRLMDGTPVRCGASRVTVNRSGLGEIAGYGRDVSHHAFYWGAKLMLITTAEGSVCAFSLAHPKELDERKQALHLLHVHQCAPGPGSRGSLLVWGTFWCARGARTSPPGLSRGGCASGWKRSSGR